MLSISLDIAKCSLATQWSVLTYADKIINISLKFMSNTVRRRLFLRLRSDIKPRQILFKFLRKKPNKFIIKTSVVDPDPYWIRIQELPGSGSTHANIG